MTILVSGPPFGRAVALALAVAVCAPPPTAAETSGLESSTWMRSRASSFGRAVRQLDEGRVVEVLERQGAWARIRFAGDEGWVRASLLGPSIRDSGGQGPGSPTGPTSEGPGSKATTGGGKPQPTPPVVKAPPPPPPVAEPLPALPDDSPARAAVATAMALPEPAALPGLVPPSLPPAAPPLLSEALTPQRTLGLRLAPSWSAGPAGSIRAGERIVVLARRGLWALVQGNSRQGWVVEAALDAPPLTQLLRR